MYVKYKKGEQIRFLVKPWELKAKFEAFCYTTICVWPEKGGKKREG